MTQARVFQPPPSSLRAKMAEAGGMTIEQLAARATETLKKINQVAGSEIDEGLKRLVSTLVGHGRAPDDEDRTMLAAAASRLLGAAGLLVRDDLAASCKSLMQLMEMMAGKPWDLPPVSVHIATIQFFIAEPNLPAAEVAELLEGLNDVIKAYQAGQSITN